MGFEGYFSKIMSRLGLFQGIGGPKVRPVGEREKEEGKIAFD